jgi:flagellar P-ring protein precursor FlgI
VRIKDLGKFSGWRENALVGYGLVTGLGPAPGDSPGNKATRQSIAHLLSQFELRHHARTRCRAATWAVVIVTASLPALRARRRRASTSPSPRSATRAACVGGSLLMTPLKGANQRVYALAQGAVAVGGYKYDMNGNVVQKNHPTVGCVPGGATIEVARARDRCSAPTDTVTFVLGEPTTRRASRVAADDQLSRSARRGREGARRIGHRRSASRRRQRMQLAPLPHRGREPLRSSRTGAQGRDQRAHRHGGWAGGDVRISRVAISHGDLKVSDRPPSTTVSQTHRHRQPPGAGVRTTRIANLARRRGRARRDGYIAASTTRWPSWCRASPRSRPTRATSSRSCARSRRPAHCTPSSSSSNDQGAAHGNDRNFHNRRGERWPRRGAAAPPGLPPNIANVNTEATSRCA